MDYQSILKNLRPEHEFFIGVDSDGCVFDSMEVKQKEFFIPNAIKYFNLSNISGILHETWEFVNLYSIHRGGNRFISLIKVFELLGERKEIIESGYPLPDMLSLKKWVNTETKLGNDSLIDYFESNYDPDLEKVVKWSKAINKEIAEGNLNIPPFPFAKKAIQQICTHVDIVIVSQTPLEALNREWEQHKLKNYTRAIAGQEHGTKSEHILISAKGNYADDRILMIGDAIGDLEAAKNNNILFYPIIAGNENKSWEKFLNEGFGKFTNKTFAGQYEDTLIQEFKKSLPSTPPWIK